MTDEQRAQCCFERKVKFGTLILSEHQAFQLRQAGINVDDNQVICNPGQCKRQQRGEHRKGEG